MIGEPESDQTLKLRMTAAFTLAPTTDNEKQNFALHVDAKLRVKQHPTPYGAEHIEEIIRLFNGTIKYLRRAGIGAPQTLCSLPHGTIFRGWVWFN